MQVHNKTKIIYLPEIFHSDMSKEKNCIWHSKLILKCNDIFRDRLMSNDQKCSDQSFEIIFDQLLSLESPVQFMNAQNKTFTWLNKCSESSPDYYLPVVLMAVINCILTLISYKNPSIYNIIRWFSGPMGQPSVWYSKYFFFS